VVDDAWEPAAIQLFGRPRPLHGKARSDAIARWEGLRACAGLAARPPGAPAPDATPDDAASVHRIGPELQDRLSSSHGRGCPLAWSDLRYLRLRYVGFDGADHTGELVVAARYARDVADVFDRLYDARWPIRRMRPVSDFAGDDDRSMAADNTSAYNCRRVVGSGRWSDHAYGAAIDINPVENPDLHDGQVRPPSGRPYARLDRAGGQAVPAGTIRAGDVVVDAFADVGWEWGGSWSAAPDYQHFSASSRPR
jgi:poly-gamma-glutamate synthesis protein (capsule biosynthesis protein)